MRAFLAGPICLVAAALVLAAPAHAADEKGKDKKSDGQYVNLSPVALPIIVDGQLINFVFVTVRLNLTPSASVTVMRNKEPFFRDALVHTAYRKPFVVPTNYAQIDVPALKARMMDEATRIAGPNVIASVELIGDPQPKRVTGLPRPKGAAAPERSPIP
jgi:hypothetical protein